MSREIKFRAWDTFSEQMFYEPYLFSPMTDHSRTECGWSGDHIYYEEWTDVDDGVSRPCFLMQYSGLNDKNGKEIWEGDILKAPSGHLRKVIWNNERACFSAVNFDGKDGRVGIVPDRVEVIGNIYQNPELIQTPAQV